MRKLLYIGCFFMLMVFSINLQAQTRFKDSLKTRLSNYTQIDTQYVLDLFQLAYQYAQDGTDTMFLLGKKVVHLSDSLGFPAGRAKGYRTICGYYRDVLQDSLAIVYCKKAIALADSIGRNLIKAKCLNNLSTAYELTHPDSAIIYLQESLDISRELGNKQWQAIGLQSLGNQYRNMANYEKSIEAHQTSLNLFKEVDTKGDGVPGQLINLATVYRARAETRKDSSLRIRDLEKARDYLEEAIPAFQKVKLPYGEMVAWLNLGQVYLIKKDYLLSLPAYERSLEMNKTLNHPGVEIAGRWGIITIKRRLRLYEESKQLAYEMLNNPEYPLAEGNIKDIYTIIHETSFEMEQWEESYFSLLKKVELEKKFEWNSQFKTNLEVLAHEYEASLQENKLALLAEENRKTSIYKYGLLALLITLILLAALWLAQSFRKRNQQKQIQTDKEARALAEQALASEKLKRTESEKQQLQAHISLKNQALSSHALQLARKNEWLQNLRSHLEQESSLQIVKQDIKSGLDLDRNWEEMRNLFEDLHPDFLSNLKKQYPDLSKSDLRLAALYKMNLSREEMLRFLAIAPESFKMARYRLRKKLGLKEGADLTGFFQLTVDD